MKKVIVIASAVLGAVLMNAQTNEKPVKVRIKKVENINGVEKVTDTTFTTNDVSSLNSQYPNIRVSELGDGKEGKIEKIVVMGDDIQAGDVDVRIMHNTDDINEEMKKALKEAGVDPDAKGNRKVVIVQDDPGDHGDSKGEKKIKKIVMVKMDVSCATAEDKRRLSSQIGNTDDKLELEKMSLYPNPGDGKFNLKFTLKNKGDAEVNIYNSEGKTVYSEKLPAFSGEYNKGIDISQNDKGIYFVKVAQGKHTMVKKVVME